MQHVNKRIVDTEKGVHTHSKPVCYFCEEIIELGEEIVLRKKEGFYHRKCYDSLFSLKLNWMNFQKLC